jgi:hypothetical protein
MPTLDPVAAALCLADDVAPLEDCVPEHADPIAWVTGRAWRRRPEEDVRLELPMSLYPEPERQTAERHELAHRRAGDVLDHPGTPEFGEGCASRGQQIGVLAVAVDVVRDGVELARRTCVDGVELGAVRGQVLERVRLVELERVPRLRRHVHTHHVEADAVVAHRRAALAAVQVE